MCADPLAKYSLENLGCNSEKNSLTGTGIQESMLMPVLSVSGRQRDGEVRESHYQLLGCCEYVTLIYFTKLKKQQHNNNGNCLEVFWKSSGKV